MATMTAEMRQRIMAQYPWMTVEMMDAYSTSYSVGGTTGESLVAVRQTASYQQVFAGNYDAESGEVRMDESDYFSSKARFDSTLLSLNLNPDYFGDMFVTGLENEVSPSELEARAEAAYERILDSAPSIREWYATNYGINMSDSAIVASIIDPTVGDQILDRRISMAEIGGAAASRGLTVATEMARELAQQGLTGSQAGAYFGTAANQIPTLDVLAKRHADTDDDFDLQEFNMMALYDDPTQRRRMRRLLSQEQSMFTGGAGTARSQTTGGLAGLAQQ